MRRAGRAALISLLFGALLASCSEAATSSASPDLCSVYDPFRVLPDNNKFQIGGAFPLHEADCKRLRPEAVQEIVAIQWALTHWNQNPNNFNSKLGLFAGDTCSRSKEAISQSLRFLDSVGYHEPDECVNKNKETNQPKLLGVIAPKDANSSFALAALLQAARLPVAAYTSPSLAALLDAGLDGAISTAPTLTVYAEAFARLMSALRSNLVAVIDDGRDSPQVTRLVDLLRHNDIFVSEIIPWDHPLLAETLHDSDSNIVLSLVNKKQLLSALSRDSVAALDKLWVAIPGDGEALSTDEQTQVLKPDAKIEVISLQPRVKELPQFRDYFLRVLKNNYQSYSLLTSYVEQVFNCSTAECEELDSEAINSAFTPSKNTDAVIRLTYAFAAVAANIGADPKKEAVCARPSPSCTELILAEFLSLDYEFGASDPIEFSGERLHFYRSPADGVLLSSGILIEALQIVNDQEAGPVVYKVLEYETGRKPRLVSSNLRREDARIRSTCSPFRPFCGQCPNVVDVPAEKHFLSIPRHYPLYVVGLFDFHEGAACQSLKGADISLPLAFVHTVWTFRQRFPQLNLLKNLDFGALLIDSCSSGKQAIESVVRAESQCFRFEQANRNITVVPGSVFGYVSALHGDAQEALKGYFSSGDTDAALVAVDPEHGALSESFTAIPSSKSQALAVLRFLKRQHWDFVTVALSEQDADSLAAFQQFERQALDRGVCLAEVVNLSSAADRVPSSSSTNVTVVFATAKDAAAFLTARSRQRSKHVHVLVGDAHDFHLHISADVGRFAGTVSVQPKDILYGDFHEWLEATTPLSLPEPWFWAHMEERWQCALSQRSKAIYSKMCSGEELLDVPRLGRMTRAGYLSRGVERFLFALDAIYKRLCPEQTGVCMEFYANGRRQILGLLKKTHVEDDVDILEWLPDKNGALSYVSIGNFSSTTGLRMSRSYRSFTKGSALESRCSPPMCKCFLDGDFFERPLNAFASLESPQPDFESFVRREPAFGERVGYQSFLEHLTAGAWREKWWNYVLLALNTCLLLCAVAVLLLVLLKLYFKIVKGNQSLGISLLVGIVLLYITAYAFVLDATDVTCRLRVLLHGLAHAICYGVMIAKATQLRNAETLGFAHAHHISFWNYWLLLFFILGVQIALSVRWVAEPFMATLATYNGESMTVCTLAREEFVLSQVYVLILLFLALFINSRNRNIKRNYKETKWLFLASVVCTLLWAAWIAAFLLAPLELKDTTVVVELMAVATVLLGFLFVPKIYILLSYEPVVVECKPDGASPDGLPSPIRLFEREDDNPTPPRAASPASSSDSCGHRFTKGSHSTTGSTSGHFSDEQSPIFHTVMRKKNRVRRSQSEHEVKSPQPPASLPEVPVISSPSRSDTVKSSSSSSVRRPPHFLP